jgi:hypothetical protein
LLTLVEGRYPPVLGLVGIHNLYGCSSRPDGRWCHARRGRLERRAKQTSTKDGEERWSEDAIQIMCIQSTHIRT